MRQISMQKNSAKCVNSICKKQLQNASNSHAKNTAKCISLICKKHYKMRQIHMQKNTAKCVSFLQIFHIFLHMNFAHFSVFFAGKFAEIVWQFSIFFKPFRDDFYGTVCRDGKGGIPVESRSKCGNPDRDCTENTRFCSAMSTKSEIVKVIPQKRLNPRSNRKPPV